MSFFGDLWDGIKSGGQWVLDHAGDIASAVSTVGKAAASLLATDTSNADFLASSALYPQSQEARIFGSSSFSRDFTYVSNRLAVEAKKRATGFSPPTGATFNTEDELVGLWRDPNGLSHNGELSQTMYQDLSIFMASLGIPVSYTDNGGNFHNTVVDVGKSLFAGTAAAQLAEALRGDDLITNVTTKVSTEDGIIHAAHAYYPIPMGNEGQDFALHSAIYILYSRPVNSNGVPGRQKPLSLSRKLQGQEGWLVTLQITWPSASTAVEAQEQFKNTLATEYSQLSLVLSHIQGAWQLVKIQTPTNGTPAEVKCGVQAAAMAAMDQEEGKNHEEPPAKQSVQVRATDVSWQTPSSLSAH
ncbi:hypothetical protein FDECE_2030 [Fusarium decemcellulare]|nr:hypothetical protein FDECE_2030 [Fusarium decemcellulare]